MAAMKKGSIKPMYNANVERVIGVQFGVMSPEEIRRRSVVEVVRRECYHGDSAMVGGLCDPRMGVLDSTHTCKTDLLDRRESPGYFGHIELARPVFFIQFLRYVQELLQMICWNCGAVLLNDDMKRTLRRYVGYARFQKAYKMQKSRASRRGGGLPCPRCQMLQPRQYQKDELQIVAKWDGDGEQNRVLMTPEYILSRFKRLTDDEIELFGFDRHHSRPEWLICSVLPVPPPTMRPSVHSDNNQRQEDDLTMKLSDIIKVNDMLKTKLASSEMLKTKPAGEESEESFTKMVESLRFLLQFHVATLIDNEGAGVSPAQQRSGRPLKCIRQRLKSKEGRVRGNLMGKRVDYSSRSVITPDPILACDELGVPLPVARNLTVPERVNPFNIQELRNCVRNGSTHPGAKVIERQNGQQRFLKYIKDLDQMARSLCVGDIVHRHMVDGDHVMFNRQPSLHKMSMMCHRVKVMNRGMTFRLCVSTTTPYNADFDGDEMNAHLAQSLEATNELKFLAAVPRQFIAPTAGAPVVVPVQDTMLATYLLSREGGKWARSSGVGVSQSFTKSELMNLSLSLSDNAQQALYQNVICATTPSDNIAWDVLSACLPAINIDSPTLKVVDGTIRDIQPSEEQRGDVDDPENLDGALTKKHFKTKSLGLVYVAFQEKGPYAASAMIDDIRGVATYYMLKRGFSVGISDLVLEDAQREEIDATLKACREDCRKTLRSMHDPHMRRDITLDIAEQQLMGSGRKLRNDVQKIVTRPNTQHACRYLDMVNAQSKGNKTNILQMKGLLGQQEVDGKLIGYGFEHRTLPHYCKYDDSMASRGFVSHSFVDGLTPQEFFFHSMTGREGLIDTAVKTAQTGYIQRRIMKVLEDLSVQHDDTVRNINEEIVQFRYGEDGFCATKIENQRILFFDRKWSNARKIWEAFHTDIEDYNRFLFGATTEEDWIRVLRDSENSESATTLTLMKTGEPVVAYCYALFRDMRFEGECNLKRGAVSHPINMERMKRNALTWGQKRKGGTPLTVQYVVDALKKLFDDIHALTDEGRVYETPDRTTHLFRALVHSHIGPRPAMDMRLTKSCAERGANITCEVYDFMMRNILQSYERATTEPGEMVGVLAAQSVGEPATQMTLNTFHYAGVGEKSNVIRGVPRLNELLQLSKKQKAPIQYIQLQPECSGVTTEGGVDKAVENATMYKNLLEYSTLRDVTHSTSIYYDPRNGMTTTPDTHGTSIGQDERMLEFFHEFEKQLDAREDTEAAGAVDGVANNDVGAADVSAGEVNNSPWVLRVEINRRAMLEKDVRMEDIVHAIYAVHEPSDICCVYADDNANTLMLRINLITRASSTAADDVEDSMDDYYLLKMLEKSLLDDVPLRGIPNLQKIRVIGQDEDPHLVAQHCDEDGNFAKDQRFRLEAEGKNLLELLGCPFVDAAHTRSNDIHEIYELLGVEAARQAIVCEIFDVINDAQAGSTDVRHIKLLADLMCHCSWGKDLLAIDRNGIKKTNIGPLAKCSFEETDKMLYQAAVFGDRDPVRGVSSNIMLGQVAPCGTGTVNILFDEEEYFRQRQASEEEQHASGEPGPGIYEQWQALYQQSTEEEIDAIGGDDDAHEEKEVSDDFFSFTLGLGNE